MTEKVKAIQEMERAKEEAVQEKERAVQEKEEAIQRLQVCSSHTGTHYTLPEREVGQGRQSPFNFHKPGVSYCATAYVLFVRCREGRQLSLQMFVLMRQSGRNRHW